MLELVLILVGTALAFLLVFWAAASYTGRVFAKIASQHVEHTDWIIQNGIAPPDWTASQRRRLAEFEAREPSDAQVSRLKSRYRERLLARLERHLRYVERATVVASESERHEIGDRVREVGRAWEESSWEQIVGEEEFPLTT